MGRAATSVVQRKANQIDLFEALEASKPITAPLGFTVDIYTREEFEKANKRRSFEHGDLGRVSQ